MYFPFDCAAGPKPVREDTRIALRNWVLRRAPVNLHSVIAGFLLGLAKLLQMFLGVSR